MLYTIGFNRRSAEQFFETLKQARVARVVDIRLSNTSQLAGFTKRDDLAYFLRHLCGAEYVHMPELAPSPELFESYKKRGGDWNVFRRQFLALMAERRVEKTVPRELLRDACLLCSEEKPEECHRSLVAEYLGGKWGSLDVRHL